MASLEKLVKALEYLKVFQPGLITEDLTKKKDQPLSKKDKITNCNSVADCICSNNLRNVTDFPKFLGIAMETFLMLCDDSESDVRMVADECLNRTIKTLLETNLGRLQVELYKEIKKNGSSRSLRASLWRFADMTHLIRPQKCRPYVVNLLPCLARICRRPEESIQETLATAMQKICPVLMAFTNDMEVKVLLKGFLPNIGASSATSRRTAASSLTQICLYTRKPTLFFSWLLNILLDMVLPVDRDVEVYTLLGVLLSLRHMMPHLANQELENMAMRGSFGMKSREPEVRISKQQLIQVYEFILYQSGHADHNVVTASLETLQQLLRNTPKPLLDTLLTSGGIPKTNIFENDMQQLQMGPRIPSNTCLPSVSDDAGLDDDIDRASEVSTGSGSTAEDPQITNDLDPRDGDDDIAGLHYTVSGEQGDGQQANGPFEEETVDGATGNKMSVSVTEGEYSNITIGDVKDDCTVSPSSSVDTLSEAKASPLRQTSLRKGVSEDRLSPLGGAEEAVAELDVSAAIQPSTALPGSATQITLRDGDIGHITDNEVPLVHCVRHLCSKFLLTGFRQGLIPDRQVRLSVKSLALGCIGSALALYPKAFLKTLHKSSQLPDLLQDIRDIFSYTSHSDPQLKGNMAVMIGNVIHAALLESCGQFSQWVQDELSEDSPTLDELVSHLVAILEDDSSVATRLAVGAFRICLHSILNSSQSHLGLKVLLALLKLRDNSYWLVKVELLELFAEVDYKNVTYLEQCCPDIQRGKHHFLGHLNIQEHVLRDVMLHLLGDEDHRVRHVASQALTRMIPRLFYAVENPQQDPVIAKAKDFTLSHMEPILHEWSSPPQPLVHGLVAPYHCHAANQAKSTTESALSRVVAIIVGQLTRSSYKQLTFGCCHALCLLSDRYLVTQYAAAWGCAPLSQPGDRTSSGKHATGRSFSNSSTGSVGSTSSVGSVLSSLSLEEVGVGTGGGPLQLVLSILTSSPIALDMSAHQDALQLAGNLFAGAAYKCLRSADEGAHTDDGRWAVLSDRSLVPLADNLLSHLARLLSVCAHVIDDNQPGPPQSKPSLPSLPNAPSLSPIKRKAKGIKEDSASSPQGGAEKLGGKGQGKDSSKESDKDKSKKEGLGAFYSQPHYMKLYDILKGAYSNYKISLDLSSSEKFETLLRTALDVLSQVLEIACLPEISKYSEEVLNLLKSTVSMEPTGSILCVQQLLKALFGTNLASQWESAGGHSGGRKPGKATRLTSSIRPGLYHSCFTTPYTQFTQCLASATFRMATSYVEQEESTSLISWLKKRAEKKIPAILKPGSKTDKASVASYIRLFEPLVIKALKQYTITSCLELQEQVLNLLAQLVQLRVNYCLLDSDQIFIGFVIKQFEYIEEGQIRNSESLIPAIFHFLVLLSYERYHSKSIIGMPKVIQLCDGVMASGQDPTTHAIPALQCIVNDLFVLRSTNKADAGKDLDTQREVVVSMLLRLISFYQVLELLIVVLHQCRKEGEDKWKRLSRQVTDQVLPLLAKQQINIDSQLGLDVVHRLFETVAPSVFRPVDILLKTLFSPPQDLSKTETIQRWLCLVLITLRVIMSQSKEEVVLSRLQELHLGVTVFTDSVTRHKFRQQSGVSKEPLNAISSPSDDPIQGGSAEETFARFLLQVIGLSATEIRSKMVSLTSGLDSCQFLCQELAHMLLYVTHMFQSGTYRRVATMSMSLIRQEAPPHFYNMNQLSTAFKELAIVQPTLTLQWCNVFILLNYDDQNYWSEVLHTPKKYMMSSPSNPNYDVADELVPKPNCMDLEIVRRGGLVLFCDYVCENLNDAEHMTWVIINHVNDLIHLSQEPPVQDFISAIHRNSAASGLFIQAIHSRCENLSNPSMVKKTLHCLEAIHLSQSGALLTLLVDKFLNTHHLSVSRICDTIACRRVEMLLAEPVAESSSQLPFEDLEKLLKFMMTTGLTRRHTRLASLLNKLHGQMSPNNKLLLSPEGTHPLAVTSAGLSEIDMNKEWFVSIARDQCFGQNVSARECAELLQHLDYSNILNIIMAKESSLTILEECIALGTQRTLMSVRQAKESRLCPSPDSPPQSPSKERSFDPLFQAAQITLFRYINNIINLLPVPHEIINFDDNALPKDESYREKMEDFITDGSWFEEIFQLASALLRCLTCMPMLPWQPSVPEESLKDIGRFSIMILEVITWMLQHDQLPASGPLQTTLECFALVLQNPQLSSVISQKDQTTWVCSAIRTVHQLLSSLLILPGSQLVNLASQESSDELPNSSFDEFHHAIRACDQISELVHCLRTHLEPHSLEPSIPDFLVNPIRNVIIGLARLPLVNSYARTPPLVWSMGWMPSPMGEMKTRLPPLPLDFLQEKDVLKEYIYRVNVLGWTSRQQFEETWMSLLGVLNPSPLSDDQHASPEEDIDRCQCSVLATRCITFLLVQSTLTPHSGNPSNSVYEHRPRDKPMAFLHTKVGKKLAHVRKLVEQETWALAKERNENEPHHAYTKVSSHFELDKNLFIGNLDRLTREHDYGLGQMSIESIWGLIGMLDPNQFLVDSGSDTTTDTTGSSSVESPQTILPPVARVTVAPEIKERSSVVGGLDIKSCLQFLLELYGQLLSPTATPKTPLVQLNETIKSVVALSDVFTEKSHYEWMFEVLLEVQKSHPVEDELIQQYLVVGICKAAAIVGMDLPTADRVVKYVDQCIKSPHLPTKVCALYGTLYLFEMGPTELTQQVLPLVTEYLNKTLALIAPTTISSQEHVQVMWTVAFYIIENYHEELKDTDFTNKIIQLAVTTVSAHEDVTPLALYVGIMKGLERLLLADVLTKQDAENLIKLSVDRLCLPSPQRSLAGLGLMLTCMYSGKHGDQWTPTQVIEQPDFFPGPQFQISQDPESLIVAMERVTVLFDRIRKGFPYEARVITRVLPSFLLDFFPPQDIMNKVIGEFLSNQQPHPQLMANVVFKVFASLLERKQNSLVHDWVMLSLSNFTQRTPVAMAVWSLSCFFISATTNTWTRSLLPHLINRMGKMETVDKKLFCISAMEFRSQLVDVSQKRAFRSTFQAVSTLGSPYTELLAMCS